MPVNGDKLIRPAVGTVEYDLALDIEHVALHDLKALNRIHHHCGGKLAAICLRIAGSSERAVDALQETYIKLWNRAGSYDRNLSRPIVWLSTLARNSAIDLSRAERRRQSTSLPLDYDEVIIVRVLTTF